MWTYIFTLLLVRNAMTANVENVTRAGQLVQDTETLSNIQSITETPGMQRIQAVKDTQAEQSMQNTDVQVEQAVQILKTDRNVQSIQAMRTDQVNQDTLITVEPQIVQFSSDTQNVQSVQVKSPSKAKLQPLWISTIESALVSGVDVTRVQSEFCTLTTVPKAYYINYDNVEPLLGVEMAEELIRNHSFIAINFEALCAQLLQLEYRNLEWRQHEYHLRQLVSNPSLSNTYQSPAVPSEADSGWDDESFGAEVKLEDAQEVADAHAEQLNKLKMEQEAQKTKEEDENELRVQQRLSEELGQKVDVERPLKIGGEARDGAPGGGPIGIDLKTFNKLNIDSLEKALRGENDTAINDIFRVFAQMRRNPQRQKLFASTHIIPLIKRVKYDAKTAPTLIEGQTVTVRVGIHIQSLSNFQLTTMDYDMDLWLRMCWRDPRLAHGLNAPVLITEEPFLRRIWRPDAFFVNAVESLFHRVTYLNFYMFVFPDGEVFYETRLYLKPKSMLVLCKYPHDSQMIYLRISSIAFTNNTVKFEWFSRKNEAIYVNHNVQLRELYITSVEKTVCDSRRKTGNYTCIEARFYMKRNLGYYLAQTYVPTATCVLFSWISVWLPEEFVEGRIFVALTVFLTLSAESNAAKEILPKVSYVKAIDIWFGFTALFVFATMLQALVVISLENISKKLKKTIELENESLSVYKATQLLIDSKRYHKLGRGLDGFFKVMYPMILIIFLFIYVFVIIEGDENKCIRGTEMETESQPSSYREL